MSALQSEPFLHLFFTLSAFCSQGGGAYVHDGGKATFMDCRIWGSVVLVAFELSKKFLPAPRWNAHLAVCSACVRKLG